MDALKTREKKAPQTPAPLLADLSTELQRHLTITLAHDARKVNSHYLYRALAISVRDRLVSQWQETKLRSADSDARKVYYLSLEFLIGRSLGNAVHNLDLDEATRGALHDYGIELEEIAEEELDAGLGNGGLGRLAACFLDSCANLKLPVAVMASVTNTECSINTLKTAAKSKIPTTGCAMAILGRSSVTKIPNAFGSMVASSNVLGQTEKCELVGQTRSTS